jgi:arylsulfatase A-like enzyme
MNMLSAKHIRILFILYFALIVLCSAAPAHAAPDLIVFLADDLGAADIGPQRRKAGLLTPNIDALGRAGIVYTAGYGQPACVQARTALMSGKWPQRQSLGAVINNGPQPLPTMMTVAERLRALGYRTHLIGKWHLGFGAGRHPLEQGFDTFLGFEGTTPSYTGDDPRAPLFHQRTQISNIGNVADTLRTEAVRILRSALTKPQFLFLAWTSPHDPLQGTLAQRVAEMDANIGLVVAAARPGSLIIFAGDNGRRINTPLRGKKNDILEGGVRVPLILSWPGQVAPGQRVGTPASLVDVAPTLVNAAGGTFPDGDGFDLLALPPNRGVFFKAYYGDPGLGVRRGPWKFYRNYLGQPAQLYNVRTDVGEASNVAAANPQVVSRMSTLLDRFAAALKN